MPEQKRMTAEDRCDRCGAQAKARTYHADGALYMLWCAHHFTEHKDKLIPTLVYLEDDLGMDRTKDASKA